MTEKELSQEELERATGGLKTAKTNESLEPTSATGRPVRGGGASGELLGDPQGGVRG
jgi:hypothetical protein